MAPNYQAVLDQAVAHSHAPGAVAFLGTPDRTIFHGAAGNRQLVPMVMPATVDTLYDLASLTKVIATTTSIMLLRNDGKLDLNQTVSELLPFPLFRQFTIRHLLTHTSGLPALSDWYREINSLDQMVERIAQVELLATPGRHRVYSDLGFLLLGKIVEVAGGEPLDAFSSRRIFQPLRMHHTMFRPPHALRSHCAPTEISEWRGGLMQGVVHDENAYAVGGVAGHAGLFSTASDIAIFCRALLAGLVLPKATLDEMLQFDHVPTYPWQGLGWKRDPWQSAAEGFLPTRAAFGHTGWTGTNLWIDRDTGFFSILLSNTPHPTREHRDNRTLRTIFSRAVAQAHYPTGSNVHTGLDRVYWDNYEAVKEKSLALLTHRPAVDQFGRGIIDVLQLHEAVDLRIVYSPEHGFSGEAEAGEKVGRQSGTVRMISLYGEQKRPHLEELQGIDLFVVDLQDVGARYYTYAATMKDCLAACAEAGVPVLVLDRPNPASGVVEGNIATETGSLVCYAPIPARHGMTTGELAYYFQRQYFPTLKLSVSPLDGWREDLFFADCNLPWLPPSPNIPLPHTPILYAGMCLFEGTNLNEGRGTHFAFHLFGAHWLHPARVMEHMEQEALAGLKLSGVTYVPRAIPGKATDPKFLGQGCRGIWVDIEDPAKARTFHLTLALLRALILTHPEFKFTPFFDTLAGGEALRLALLSQQPVSAIIAAHTSANAAFSTQRLHLYQDDPI